MASVASSRAAVNRLLASQVLRRRSAEVGAESALRGAWASAALDGFDRPLAAVRAWDGVVRDDADAVLRGALRVSAAIPALAPVWRRAPLQALARLHVLAASGAVPEAELGRPAAGGVRLTALAELATGPAGVPAVVEAAVIHGELLAVAPFDYGNGVVARGAARLVLLTRGLDPQSLTVPEVGAAERAADYRAAAAAYAVGTPDGVIGWVVACADALEVGAREALGICTALMRIA